MSEINKLISGFRVFKATQYQEQREMVGHILRQGIQPKTMIICCSDMRIAPGKIFSSNPGEIYVVRNIAGLVPTYTETGAHGVLAAIEYAVRVLNVENIVVMGHSKCDGIKALMSDAHDASHKGSNSIQNWLSIANEARDAVKAALKDKSQEEQEESCAQESIILSLKNLLGYPWIMKRIEENKISVFGWYFDIEEGNLRCFNPDTQQFETVM
ncbi:hypothetical protein N9W34_00540 [Rickettsiales bacterium]|nr:hypothetical protein [Rickettsiales bacterium]